jgi:hypothetical protein
MELLWVKTATGRKMPLDAKPDPKGNLVVIDGVAHHVHENGAAFPDTAERYRSHFATCPNAAQHRRRE